jgi:hypothetical protein
VSSSQTHSRARANYDAAKAASAAAYRELVRARDASSAAFAHGTPDAIAAASAAEERAEVAYREAADDARIARDEREDAHDWDRPRDGFGNYRD